MDVLSPKSLEDFSIDLLAEKPEILWRWKDDSALSKPGEVEWRDPELFLHRQLADNLLELLNYYGKLGDGILSTFTQEHVCLKNVKLHDHNATKDGLQVLSHHKLISLDLRGRHFMSICTLLQCIGNKSYESLQHLIIDDQIGCMFWPDVDDELDGQSVFETLSRFNCLKSLVISQTDVTDTMLTILGKSLLHVENLNLSWNRRITDISPLKNCQKTLKSLSLCGVLNMKAECAMATFMTLTGLTYLDLSLSSVSVIPIHDYKEDRHGKEVFKAAMLLQMPDILPNLVCLDLSLGRRVDNEHALSQFLDAHHSLQTLMLWGSDACEFKSLQDYRPRLTVGGHATIEQYVAVSRHWTRTGEYEKQMGSLRRFSVARRLSNDLETKHLPPCDDDILVQALCFLPMHPGLHDTWPRDGCFCLEAISLLLEKGVIRHLEPDTKQRLLRFCRTALQHPQNLNNHIICCGGPAIHVIDGYLPDAHELANKILERLGELQNPLW